MKEYKFKINGKEFDVTVNSADNSNASVTVNGVQYTVEFANTAAPVATPVAPAPQAAPVAAAAPAAPAAAAPSAGKTITSPLPGVIIGIYVEKGDAVKRGQKVAVVEAMKMENEVLAECDGTVSKVYVTKGDSLLEGANILTIE